MYYGHLKGHLEYIFRQSDYGGIGHIAVNPGEYLTAWSSDDLLTSLRIDTWCGRNYKYGSSSTMTPRSTGVRNACEFCFVEYVPEEEEYDKEERDYRKVYQRNIPF